MEELLDGGQCAALDGVDVVDKLVALGDRSGDERACQVTVPSVRQAGGPGQKAPEVHCAFAQSPCERAKRAAERSKNDSEAKTQRDDVLASCGKKKPAKQGHSLRMAKPDDRVQNRCDEKGKTGKRRRVTNPNEPVETVCSSEKRFKARRSARIRNSAVSSVLPSNEEGNALHVEPGTAIVLKGIVWKEMPEGILVVNVSWRGKTYCGTLLDLTHYSWAAPRRFKSRHDKTVNRSLSTMRPAGQIDVHVAMDEASIDLNGHETGASPLSSDAMESDEILSDKCHAMVSSREEAQSTFDAEKWYRRDACCTASSRSAYKPATAEPKRATLADLAAAAFSLEAREDAAAQAKPMSNFGSLSAMEAESLESLFSVVAHKNGNGECNPQPAAERERYRCNRMAEVEKDILQLINMRQTVSDDVGQSATHLKQLASCFTLPSSSSSTVIMRSLEDSMLSASRNIVNESDGRNESSRCKGSESDGEAIVDHRAIDGRGISMSSIDPVSKSAVCNGSGGAALASRLTNYCTSLDGSNAALFYPPRNGVYGNPRHYSNVAALLPSGYNICLWSQPYGMGLNAAGSSGDGTTGSLPNNASTLCGMAGMHGASERASINGEGK